MNVPDDLACSACGYLLRGHDPQSRCPECGQRVRRTLATVRLRAWRRLRWGSPAVGDGFAGLFLAMPVLLMVCSITSVIRTPRDPTPFVITGIGVGLCFTMFLSSMRRTRGRVREVMLVCGLPTILATGLWLLIVLRLILH